MAEDGSWESHLNTFARHFKPSVIKLPIKHYDTAEALAMDLQKLVSA